MLRCMPFWNACNRQIDYIDRRHCNLTVVPEEVIRPARTLEELRLDANMIRELPRGLYRLTMLRKLTLSDNDIGKISPDIGHLVNLQEFDASRNDIEDIPDTIKLCKNLQVVDFSGNPLTKLPEGFTELRNLTQLVLNDVSLNKLPTDIGSLSKLEILELRENLIKFLPASFSMLAKLEVIDLGCNMLEELPPSIGQLPNVQVLLLDGNDIMEISKDLGNLHNLTDLDISENKIERLPDEIGNLTCLTDMLLSVNHLESLPSTIGNLTKLRILKVDQNQLLSIPEGIGKCSQLEELILTENLISELPASIGKLKMLSNFNVDRNRLETIPAEIGTCTRLGVLSLRDNRLNVLPSECGNLKELHVLDVSGNRLHHLPLSLGTCNLKAIWLSDNQAQPLLKFQEDIDESSGEKVLTCFLLPQEAYQTESMENLLKGSVNTGDRDSWNDLPPRPPAVGFVGVEDSDSLENDEESHFVRQNTPHPKELRSRHGRMAKKDVDGPIIPHNPSEKEKNDVSFVPSRDMDYCDSLNSTSANKVQPPKVKISPPASPHDDDSSATTRSKSVPTNRVLSNGSPALESDRAPSGNDATANMTSDGEDIIEEAEDSDTEVQGRVRHVGFVEFDEPEKESRLRRRDTPHHLKNKRITGGVGKGPVDPEEKLRQILAQVEGRRRSSEGSGTVSVSGGDITPTTPDVLSNEESTVRDSAAGKSGRPKVLFSVSAEDSGERELTIHMKRETGMGLGISIAGGRGSTPYKNDDGGIFVSRVAVDSLSYCSGLRVDDKLLSVNGVSMQDVDHHQAVTLLKEAKNEISLVVLRNSKSSDGDIRQDTIKSSEGTLELGKTVVVSLKRDKFGLGFSIAGGKGSPPFKGNDESIFISKVTAGGAAHTNGNVLVGDKIISINGIDVTEARHAEAVTLLTSSSLVSMVLYRELLQSTAASPLASPSGSVKSDPKQSTNVPYQSSQYSSPTHKNYEKSCDSSVSSKSNDVSNAFNAKPKQTVLFGDVQTIDGNVRPDIVRYKSGSSEVVSPSHSLSASLSPTRSSSAATTAVSPSHSSAGALSFTHNSIGALSPTHSSPDSPAYASAHSSFPSSPPSSLPHPPSSQNTPHRTVTPGGVTLSPHSPPHPAKYSTELTTNCEQSVPEGVSELFKALDRKSSSSAGEDFTTKHPYPVQTVVLYKRTGSLGLSIVGGRDHTSHPFGIDEPGIFISKVLPNGAASETTMRVGDRILSVNGVDLRKATHKEAVACLTTPANKITLVVRRDPQPPHMQEIVLERFSNEKFGMCIRGGAKSRAGNPLDMTDEGIFVSKITSNGAVARNGCFRVGQRILEVNGDSVLGATHEEAIDLIRKASTADRITFLVCYGFDPSLISDTEPNPTRGGSTATDTGSSIDCDETERASQTVSSLTPLNSRVPSGSPRVSSPAVNSSSTVNTTVNSNPAVVNNSFEGSGTNHINALPSIGCVSQSVNVDGSDKGSIVSVTDKQSVSSVVGGNRLVSAGVASPSLKANVVQPVSSMTGSIVTSRTGSKPPIAVKPKIPLSIPATTGSSTSLNSTGDVVSGAEGHKVNLNAAIETQSHNSTSAGSVNNIDHSADDRLQHTKTSHDPISEPLSTDQSQLLVVRQRDAKEKLCELEGQHENQLPENVSLSDASTRTEVSSRDSSVCTTDDLRLKALNEAATNLTPAATVSTSQPNDKLPREKFLSTAKLEFDKEISPTSSLS